MKPTPCPSRLKELISLANLEPDSEARKHLKTIANAFRAKRQQQNKADFIDVPSPFAVRVNLETGELAGVYDELALALEQAEAESSLERIRECPICAEIFWAGRSDAEACSKHAARLRKQNERRRIKEREEKRTKERARRKEKQAEKPLQLSITTATILDAVFDNSRTLEHIADYCYMQLHKDKYGISPFSGIYRKVNVERGLSVLEIAGFLTRGEQQASKNPRYVPTEKAKRLRRELLYPTTKHHYFRYAVAEGPITA